MTFTNLSPSATLPLAKSPRMRSALGLAAVSLLVMAGSALAQTPAPEAAATATAAAPAAAAVIKANPGDTAWMLISSALVLMMSVPGLALFYGGLVRSKNMLSVLTQVFMIVSLVGVIWVIYGYSLAFGDGGAWAPYIGGLNKVFLSGVTADSTVPTFSNGTVIPEYAYMVFQMTFAMITPALIIGSFAERMKFSAVILFTALWVTLIYFPIAHWVWGTAAPDDIANAAKAVAAAADDAAKKVAQAKLDGITGSAGWLAQAGALDFAGGTVVHIDAGIAGLVGCLLIGKRLGYPREPMPPHSLTMTMIGASLLWVGWFGFNAGSNLEANGTTALAFVNTMVATAAAAMSWLFVEWIMKGRPSLLGMASGAVAGLVAVTPASGYAGPMGSVVLGLLVSPLCWFFVAIVREKFHYDDALDVFGVHCIGGIFGAIMTGILVAPSLGGTGITDYTNFAHNNVGEYNMGQQVLIQLKAVIATLVYSGAGSAILYWVVDMVVGLRVAPEKEREGLDIAEHGERAYNY